MDLILYHRNCPDGFCAAFIARKRYPEAELLGLNHGEPNVLDRLLTIVADKNVLMVDFSLRTRDQNIAVKNAAKSFRILDHHRTAEAELKDLDFATFDMNRSGAGLTWDTLFGAYDHEFYNSGHEIRIGPGRPMYIGMPETQRPWYVDYVEDRDLWRHKLARTKEINAYIMTLPHTEEAWRQLDSMSANQAAELGVGALAHVDHYVREVVEHRQAGELMMGLRLGRYKVSVANVPYLNCSEVGNILAEHADVGMTWFERGDGQIQFSLRSVGDIDVSEIAKCFNGGGHSYAAGFQMGLKQGREFIDQILNR